MGGGFSKDEGSYSQEVEIKASNCPCTTTDDVALYSYTKSRGGSVKCKYEDAGYVKFTKNNKPEDMTKVVVPAGEDGASVYCSEVPTNVLYKK